jgi:pimeloyl-ACP methyl ester carboxylesterase
MHEAIDHDRRRFFGAAALTFTAAELGVIGAAHAEAKPAPPSAIKPGANTSFAPLKQIDAGVLNIGYAEAGPPNGSPVFLLHGWPYDIHDYIEVAPILAAQGYRVIIPHLRGHGSTHFLDTATPRTGQQAAIGVDVIALMDALKIPTAVLAGYDWGGRAACVVAALWPERCTGLVSVNDYLIQDIAHAGTPLPAKLEWGIWTQFYFATERGRAGLAANRNDIARLLWTNESPTWIRIQYQQQGGGYETDSAGFRCSHGYSSRRCRRLHRVRIGTVPRRGCTDLWSQNSRRISRLALDLGQASDRQATDRVWR